MTTIKNRIEADYLVAFKGREGDKTSCFRMLKAAIKNKEIDAKKPLDDEGLIALLATEVKKRQESVEQFTLGGRAELAAKEASEIELIQQYLPKAMSDEELNKVIEAAIRESGAKTPKEMGMVMKLIASTIKGRADGKKASQLVQEKLK